MEEGRKEREGEERIVFTREERMLAGVAAATSPRRISNNRTKSHIFPNLETSS